MSDNSSPNFPIVGIGASAGGLKAIEKVLLNLPSNTNMAYVIVQHLSRRFKSLMQDILAKDTKMPVVMVEDGMKVEPNHVYLIPAGFEIRMENRKLILDGRKQDDSPHFVIDIFLHTLGKDAGDSAVGVILSGTGTDGSRGIRTVKENGGIVMVQDPKSGEFDGMPLSAIDTQVVDFILPPEGIAEKLTILSTIGSERFLEEHPQASKESEKEDNYEIASLTNIMDLVKKYHDVDFSQYKLNTIKRRIDKQMSAYHISNLTAFYKYLLDNPLRIDELFHELLIGVTEFFRDPKAYETLEKLVFPKLVRENKHKEIRVWICACSTGEEVYSLAIAMHKYASERKVHPQFTFIATDVNSKSLATASKGHYAPSKVSNLPEEVLDTYFNYNGEKYEVRGFIRDSIIFARNDATIDPPFINLDMISCRNFLIYLQPPIQRKLLLNFHFGLKPGAFLWLGSSENVLDFKDNFTVVNEKWKVFQTWGKTPKIKKFYSIRNPERGRRVPSYWDDPTRRIGHSQQLRQTRFSYAKTLLDRFVPTSILINDEFHILYIAGGAGKYLNLPDMEISKDILSMISQPMVMVVRDALRRLMLEEGPLLYPKVNSTDNGKPLDIQIETIDTQFDRPVFLIELKETGEQTEIGPTPTLSVIDSSTVQADSYEVIRDLQNELAIAKQEVQNSLEELETSNEELQSSNEELLASNEELQSTNEELQSVNEELYTVNSELQARNKELTDANATIDNLLANTDIGTLFLDSTLQIKLFTPTFTKVLELTENDRGTSIEKFRFNWDYASFTQDLEKAQKNHKLIEREVTSGDGLQHYLVRINPLLVKQNLEGIIILLIDITNQKKEKIQLKRAEENQRRILNFLPVKLSIIDEEGKIRFTNTKKITTNGKDLTGQLYSEILEAESKEAFLQAFAACKSEKKVQVFQSTQTLASGESETSYIEIHPFEEEDTPTYMLSYLNPDGYKLVNSDQFKKVGFFDQLTLSKETFISIKDSQFRYVYANNGLLNFLKKPRNSVIGSNDFALFPGDIAAQIRANDENVLSSQEEKTEIETLTYHDKTVKVNVLRYLAGRKEHPYLVQIGTPLNLEVVQQNEQGLPEDYIKLEKLVDQRTQSLIKTNQELKTLTRTMAHDLRGPLRAIHAFGEMLKVEFTDKLASDEKNILDKILRQSGQMAQIIDGLLSYLKIERLELKKEWIDMKALVEEVWEDLQYLRASGAYQLVLRDTPAIWADFSFTKQIFSNLMSNALKYKHPSRDAVIEVGAYQKEDADHITYFVKDNGMGFESSENEEVFTVFTRLHEAKSIDGHGIGLSIVKKATEIQGGSIRAQGILGEGATFYLSFPSNVHEVQS